MRRFTSPSGKVRRGSVALEALFVLPLLVGALVAFFELTAIVSVENKLARASHAAAKAASNGADLKQIEQLVEFNLGPGPLHDHHTIKIAMVVRGTHGEHLVPVEHPEHLPPHTPIVVTVEAPARKVVPNLLRSIGVKLSEEELMGQTTMWKE